MLKEVFRSSHDSKVQEAIEVLKANDVEFFPHTTDIGNHDLISWSKAWHVTIIKVKAKDFDEAKFLLKDIRR